MVYRRHMRCLVLPAALLLTTPAFAAATDWQELAPGARARLISADTLLADGSTLVAVEIDMLLDTKTYWRVPGETGIPTTFDFSGSAGIGDTRILWPYPTLDRAAGFLDYAYFGPTVLPVSVAVTGEAPEINLSVVMGVCSDICVPVQARFSLPISFDEPDAGQSLRIDQAVANVPILAEDNGVIGDVTLAAEGVSVSFQGAEIDPASVIAATADPAILFGAPQKSPDNDLVILPLLGGGELQSLVGQLIEINFMTPAGPYLVERKIVAAESTPAAP
jgi:DsbC/DsbD-like thiol-disulfide interchange protein